MTSYGSRSLAPLLLGALVFACASEDAGLPEGTAGSSVAAGAAGRAGSAPFAGAGGLPSLGGSGGAAAGGSGALGGASGNGAQSGAAAASGAGGSLAVGGAGSGAAGAAHGGAGGLAGVGGGASPGGSAGSAGAAGGAAAGTAGASGDPRIVLVAGTGKGGDGTPATQAAVLNPYGAVVDPITGDVFIAEVDTGKIRRIDQDGIISTVVGPGAPGAAADIELDQPHDLLFQPETSTLFIADTMNGNVYRYDAGEIERVVGAGAPFPGVSRVYCLAFSPSGTDLYYTGPDDVRVIDLTTMSAKPAVNYPAARVIAIDSKGKLYAVKNRPNGDALQVVDAAGNATDMPATLNVVSDPKHITVDLDDNVLIADTELQLIRRYDVLEDRLDTLVGNGMVGTGTLGGLPQNAQVRRPHGIFQDPKTGAIFVSDSENDRVVKIVQ